MLFIHLLMNSNKYNQIFRIDKFYSVLLPSRKIHSLVDADASMNRKNSLIKHNGFDQEIL